MHLSKRVTIMLDDDLDKKIRNIQAKKISKTGLSYSFSQALNDQLKRAMK
jgi:predicted transcriptional regulator